MIISGGGRALQITQFGSPRLTRALASVGVPWPARTPAHPRWPGAWPCVRLQSLDPCARLERVRQRHRTTAHGETSPVGGAAQDHGLREAAMRMMRRISAAAGGSLVGSEDIWCSRAMTCGWPPATTRWPTRRAAPWAGRACSTACSARRRAAPCCRSPRYPDAAGRRHDREPECRTHG